jgi:hypothetical protein
MNTIEIHYYPFPRVFSRLKLTWKGTYPEQWEEMNAKQLMAAAMAWKGTIGNVPFFSAMTGIRPMAVRRLDEYYHLKLAQLTAFINQPEPVAHFIAPEIRIKGKVYVSPKPRLAEMIFGQFIFADSFYSNYAHTRNPAELNSFLAAVYTEKGKPYTEKGAENAAAVMAYATDALRESVLLNWQMIREWLGTVYPLLFTRDTTGETKKTAGKEDPPHDALSWVKVFESLVGDDVINADRYAMLHVNTVFRYMTSKIKENLRQKSAT